MINQSKAFTLIELLVSMTLFVSLMGLVTSAFQRISSGSDRTLQALELHRKADAIMRFLDSDVNNMQQFCAVHLQNMVEPYTLTFMRPANNSFDEYFHSGATESTQSDFSAQAPRLTDMVWVRWEWRDGAFYQGYSRNNVNSVGEGEQWQTSTYLSNSQHVIREVEVDLKLPKGMQSNGLTTTPQRHYDFFEGMGSSIFPIDKDGSCTAKAGQKVAVYEKVNCEYQDVGSFDVAELFDYKNAPWRLGDYRHLYTTLECGNSNQIPDAYAVRNPDGLTVNKDKLNLVGHSVLDPYGDLIYPNQIRFLFDGVEYLEMELVKRDGGLYTSSSDESDRLNDGNKSIDISGVDPLTGEGADKRPTALKLTFLLHKIDIDVLDDEDFDFDGDIEESLASAIRDRVNSEESQRADRIRLYRRYASKYGFASLVITQSVKIGL